MGFSIDYGSPGLIGMLVIAMLAFVAIVTIAVLMRSAKDAHDEVVHDIEDHGGDLRG